jgi:hypothetical protein
MWVHSLLSFLQNPYVKKGGLSNIPMADFGSTVGRIDTAASQSALQVVHICRMLVHTKDVV